MDYYGDNGLSTLELDFYGAHYSERLQNQMVQWEQESALIENHFEQAGEMLAEPNMDVLTATLYLGQLNHMQFHVFVSSNSIRMLRKLEERKELQKAYHEFLKKSRQLADDEINEFYNRSAPSKEEEFISWFDRVSNFYGGFFGIGIRGDDSPGALQKAANLDQEFYDAVGHLIDDYKVTELNPEILELLRSMNGSAIDDIYKGQGGRDWDFAYQFYKKIENLLAELITGDEPPILMPGTKLVNDALTTIRGALSNYLTNIQDVTRKKIEAVLQKKDGSDDLFMKFYSNTVNDYGESRLATIRRVIESYYTAMLSIVERVAV